MSTDDRARDGGDPTPERWLPDEDEFRAAALELDALVREFEALPFPEVREMVFALLAAVDTVHRGGLGRLTAFLRERGQGALLDEAAREPLIGDLLALYDLAPAPELVAPSRAALAGRANGAAATPPVPGFIPLGAIRPAAQLRPRPPAMTPVMPLADLPPETLIHREVGDAQLLLVGLGGELRATRGNCPGSMAPLHLGQFRPPILVCPWHNDAFDLRTGERIDGGTGPGLALLPTAVINGVIHVALDAAPAATGVRR